MKTALRNHRFTSFPLLALAFTFAAAIIPAPARANTTFVPASHTLNITENSSTTLSLSYVDELGNPILGQFTQQNTGIDTWTITITNPQNFSFTNPDMSAFWREPEDPNEANEVRHSTDDNNHIFVESDESLIGYVGASLIVNDGTPVQFGLDGTTPFFIRFVDHAAQNEAGNGVPDRASTFTLLSLSIAGLLGLRRFRISRSA